MIILKQDGHQNGNPKDVFTQLIAEAQTNGAAYITLGTLKNAVVVSIKQCEDG